MLSRKTGFIAELCVEQAYEQCVKFCKIKNVRWGNAIKLKLICDAFLSHDPL